MEKNEIDNYKNPWYYLGNVVNDVPQSFYGFVYLIKNKTNDKKYIGKKLFWHKKYKTVNKRKKSILVESDWKNYYGSSKELLEDVEKFGKENFDRIILHLCKTKGECSYYETYEQFSRQVLLKDEYYNNWISCKISEKHLSNIRGKK